MDKFMQENQFGPKVLRRSAATMKGILRKLEQELFEIVTENGTVPIGLVDDMRSLLKQIEIVEVNAKKLELGTVPVFI